MHKYFVIDEKELTATQLVDKLGDFREKAKKAVKQYEKLRNKLSDAYKNNARINGKRFCARIEIYDHTYLNERKVKKLVPPKLLKKLYSTTEDCKRVVVKPLTSKK